MFISCGYIFQVRVRIFGFLETDPAASLCSGGNHLLPFGIQVVQVIPGIDLPGFPPEISRRCQFPVFIDCIAQFLQFRKTLGTGKGEYIVLYPAEQVVVLHRPFRRKEFFSIPLFKSGKQAFYIVEIHFFQNPVFIPFPGIQFIQIRIYQAVAFSGIHR